MTGSRKVQKVASEAEIRMVILVVTKSEFSLSYVFHRAKSLIFLDTPLLRWCEIFAGFALSIGPYIRDGAQVLYNGQPGATFLQCQIEYKRGFLLSAVPISILSLKGPMPISIPEVIEQSL